MAVQTVEADAGIRTPDPFITSEVLYQLSYVGGFARMALLRLAWRSEEQTGEPARLAESSGPLVVVHQPHGAAGDGHAGSCSPACRSDLEVAAGWAAGSGEGRPS